MADYKTIHGIKVKSYTTDPDNIIEGQVWYDKTNKVLQFETPNVTTTGAWRTSGSLNTARSRGAGSGTKEAGLLFGGDGPKHVETESYNGVSWTEVNDLNTTSRNLSGCGISTAAMAMGRYNPTASNYELVEHFNGTSWTEVADMSTSRHSTSGCGTQGAGLCAGGGGNSNATEEFSAVFTVTTE